MASPYHSYEDVADFTKPTVQAGLLRLRVLASCLGSAHQKEPVLLTGLVKSFSLASGQFWTLAKEALSGRNL